MRNNLDKQREREERILKTYCEEEGFDYASLTEQEKTDYWFFAEENHNQRIIENSQFGLGA